MDWIGVEKITDKTIGFIYCITDVRTNEFYIGRKSLTKYKTINKKKIYSVSDWIKYYSSHKELKKRDKQYLKREIIYCCNSLIDLTYQEMRYQIKYECMEHPWCLNENILGRFYKGRLYKNG